jgi:glycogen operon protein
MTKIKEHIPSEEGLLPPGVNAVRGTVAEFVARYQVEPGRSHPLGAVPDEDGVNFCIFTERATAVTLLLFDRSHLAEPLYTIELDPKKHKTFHFWHIYIRGLKPGIHYGYRVDGPKDLAGYGDRYNPNKVLIDPYARGNDDALWRREDACGEKDNLATSMRSVVIDTRGYDWEGDQPLNRPMSETIIYEMHVRGFTQSPSSGCRHPGTFAGVIEKIPYLQDLGITAVELMPVFDFDETEIKQYAPDGTPLTNYWGYDPISFFSPQSCYCLSPEEGKHITEFRDMVKALHQAGIEVILDVVFNHTGEGNDTGPTINLKGLANNSYYLLSPQDKRFYLNYSGCGNTINGNHPITEKLIVDALEYWVIEMHVDGFRFDEAVILCRDVNGVPMVYPPVIWQIELSEVLADTKIIAEAWDAAGLYAVGYFPGYRWSEWNGRYRDIVRRFVRGDQGYIDDGRTIVGKVASVIAGSADIFQASGELPINSVNFVTAHDGFTLNDLVSYNVKHNEANGEGNRDGNDNNLSWNCGVEGETDDPAIEALRTRQIKNFAAILLLSLGVPMFVAGDEVRRTQYGNNNAYCQDNEVSWFDWRLVQQYQGMQRFFRQMIAFRKSHASLHRKSFFDGKQVNERGFPDITWHGCLLHHPGWFDHNSRVLAFTIGGFVFEDMQDDTDIHIMLNMDEQALDFEIPRLTSRRWYRVVDTALPSPDDIAEDLANPGEGASVADNVYHVTSHSVVVLISR